MKHRKSIRSVAIVLNPQKPKAQQALPLLQTWFGRRKIKIFPKQQLAKADTVITLGGDGTILSIAPDAARAGVPVLGVNIGRLGFMTAIDSDHMLSGLERWLKGRWLVSPRMMLEVDAPGADKPVYALNDAVIRTGATTRVTNVLASIDKEDLGHFVGDGVIVATPTGSTAYSLAAQGPVVHPEVEALILTPICAHSFAQRPVVYPASQNLELKLDDHRGANEVQLCLDGQRVFRLKTGDRVRVRKSKYKLELLHGPETTYFGILREKLLWGER